MGLPTAGATATERREALKAVLNEYLRRMAQREEHKRKTGHELPHDYFDRYRENIGAVTKDSVERVAKRHIDPDHAVIVIVGNAKQIREPLGELGVPVHEMDIDGKIA